MEDRLRDIALKIFEVLMNIRVNIDCDNKDLFTPDSQLKEAIDALPNNAYFRFSHFPNGCCVDASYVLAEILMTSDEFKDCDICCIEAIESPIENHFWVLCNNISIDVTWSQLGIDKNNVFVGTEHPYLKKYPCKNVYEIISTKIAKYVKKKICI